jgi:hypothetical protein
MPATLPLRLDQTCSQRSAAATLAVVVPAALAACSAPLASYSGVTHRVRASLAGSRHELILVHHEREKSILLSVAPRTSQADVERVAALLGQRQIPPSERYRFNGLWPRMVTQPLLDASHA